MNPYRSSTFKLPRRAWPDWALDLLAMAMMVCAFGILGSCLAGVASNDWRFVPVVVAFGVLLVATVRLHGRVYP